MTLIIITIITTTDNSSDINNLKINLKSRMESTFFNKWYF